MFHVERADQLLGQIGSIAGIRVLLDKKSPPNSYQIWGERDGRAVLCAMGATGIAAFHVSFPNGLLAKDIRAGTLVYNALREVIAAAPPGEPITTPATNAAGVKVRFPLGAQPLARGRKR